ncbi:MAG: acyl-CoA thioesterase [Syntrophales bacterium]
MQPGVVKLRVIYADTDAMGIVYHTNYIKWFEIGRVELMREIGFVYSALESHGYYMPATKAFCHYLWPAKYDDIIQIETKIDYLRHASMKFNYEIWDEKREKLLVEGYTVHAFTNKQGKIVRPPKEMVDRITGLKRAAALDPDRSF